MTAKFRESQELIPRQRGVGKRRLPVLHAHRGLDRAPRAFGAEVAPAPEALGAPHVLSGSTQVTVRDGFGSQNLDSVQKMGERLLADVERSAGRLGEVSEAPDVRFDPVRRGFLARHPFSGRQIEDKRTPSSEPLLPPSCLLVLVSRGVESMYREEEVEVRWGLSKVATSPTYRELWGSA